MMRCKKMLFSHILVNEHVSISFSKMSGHMIKILTPEANPDVECLCHHLLYRNSSIRMIRYQPFRRIMNVNAPQHVPTVPMTVVMRWL
jgi:hypothetical protein